MNATREAIDRAAEVATAVVSDAAGAVADPGTAAQMLRKNARRLLVPAIIAAVVVLVTAMVVRRRDSE